MNTELKPDGRMTGFRWVICALLFFALTVNYLDRQVLSLTWVEFIAPEFHWTNEDYGTIAGLFSLFYAIGMLFAGRFVDWLDTRKGYLWAIGIWSFGACLHAFCGIATSGITAGKWFVGFEGAREAIAAVSDVSKVVNVSVALFVLARLVLAVGEAGNFPAAIKATAEYFPKKDRAFSTSIFNSGSTIGALAAPITIPFIAKAWGWEMAFIIIGALGFVWMGFWQWLYRKPAVNPRVNKAELEYIMQDSAEEPARGKKLSFIQCFRYRQTWAFAIGKFMTDGVWWFLLFWAPAYLQSVYGMSSTQVALPLFVLYMITMLSIVGGWLPSYFIGKKKMDPYAGRMRAMLIFAFFPLLASHHRYSCCGPSGLVRQYLLYGRGHVPEIRRGDSYRHRRDGRGNGIFHIQQMLRCPVRLFRVFRDGVHGIRRDRSRLFHHILHLLGALSCRMGDNEASCPEIQAY